MTDSDPVINSTNVYPTLTEYGVEQGYNNITIDYFDTSVKRLYKIDDGEWKDYKEKDINLKTGETVYAKGIDKNGKETETVSHQSILPTDALGVEAYDGDTNTSYSFTGSTKKIFVDKVLWNKNIKLYYTSGGRWSLLGVTISFYNNLGEVLQKITDQSFNKNIMIPENTSYIECSADAWGDYTINLYEIMPDSAPNIIFTNKIGYPRITETGIKNGFNFMKINYFSNNIKKLYRIDNDDWKVYSEEYIELGFGHVLYAKGIRTDGKETDVSSYKSECNSEYLPPEVFDNNETTGTRLNAGGGYRYIYVDENVAGTKYKVISESYPINHTFYREDGTEIMSEYEQKEGYKVIPEGTRKIKISNSQSIGLNIYELKLITTSVQSETSKKMIVSDNNSKEETITIPNFVNSPTINVSDANRYTSSKEITISYPSGGYENQYSLDGENWLNYTGSFTIDKETTVLARSMSNGNVISSSSYQITKIDNVKPTISLDDIPNEINLGDEYKLPTDYSFYNNKSGGSIKCLLDDTEEVTSTKDIIAGRHKIICSATTGSGIITTVEKNINVVDNSKQQEEKNDSNQDERPEESVKEGEVSEETKKIDEENKTEEFSTNSN